MQASNGASYAARACATAGILAAALWFGGLSALGAVVAPIIAPNYPDAMTVLFRRFDKVAMTCAAIVLVTEAIRVVLKERVAMLEAARIGAAAIAGGLAVWVGMVLSPKIEALHQAGGTRAGGDLAAEFHSVHVLAETLAKIELALVVLVIALHVFGLRPAKPAPPTPPAQPTQPTQDEDVPTKA